MFKVEVGSAALVDIEQTYLWLKGQPATVSTADAWFTGISEAILSLESMPRRCPLAPEAPMLGREIRQLHFGKANATYRILFLVYGKQAVHVLRIRHAKGRNLDPDELIRLPPADDDFD